MSARAAAFAAGVAGALACSGPVEPHVHEIDPSAWKRLAVAPFSVAPEFARSSGAAGAAKAPVPAPEPASEPIVQPAPGAGPASAAGTPGVVDAAEAAARLTRIASEAFAAAGFDTVPASDLAHAYSARGETLPQGDPGALGRRAAEEFGATALLLGRVSRWRERQGGELGATRPASVGFLLEVRAAPSGRLLWSSQFDHTQKALSADLFRAPRYPGGGTRWLSAAELARWGVEEAARQAREGR